MRTSQWPELPVSAGFGFPAGFTAGIVVTLVAVAAGATRHPGWLVLALAVVVAVVSAISTVPAALGTTVTSWCLLDGFVLGSHGDLVFTPDAGRDAAILALVALVMLTVTAAIKAVRGLASRRDHAGIARP